MRVGGDEVHAADFFGFPDGGYTKVLERGRWCKRYPWVAGMMNPLGT